jgi:hypothetical protein
MSTTEKLQKELSNLDISNIYVYVGDAVRWDHLHDKITDKGTVIKTVAASTTSSTSFSSILTGLNPTTHGVYSFNNKLNSKIPTLLDYEKYETNFYNSIFRYASKQHTGVDPIFKTLQIEPPSDDPSFVQPFLHIERGPGGHAPYGDFCGTAEEYFESNPQDLRSDYRRSIELDYDLFKTRLESIHSEGISDDTLVVYMSDHGELLGEGGMVGHNSPMRPETVYVPTVFIHPDISNSLINSEIIGHTDIYPTILDILGIEYKRQVDGQSLLTNWPTKPKTSLYYNEFISNPLPIGEGKLRYDGVWEEDGGYVFARSPLKNRLLILSGKIYKSPKRHYYRHNLLPLLKSYYIGNKIYGDPSISLSDAKGVLEMNYSKKSESFRQVQADPDEEKLEALGYL